MLLLLLLFVHPLVNVLKMMILYVVREWLWYILITWLTTWWVCRVVLLLILLVRRPWLLMICLVCSRPMKLNLLLMRTCSNRRLVLVVTRLCRPNVLSYRRIVTPMGRLRRLFGEFIPLWSPNTMFLYRWLRKRVDVNVCLVYLRRVLMKM